MSKDSKPLVLLPVTVFYTERSLSQELVLPVTKKITCGELREMIRKEVDTLIRKNWDLQMSPLHPEPSSIMLSSDDLGPTHFSDMNAPFWDTIEGDDDIYAIVPCPTVQTSTEIPSWTVVTQSDKLQEPLKDVMQLKKERYDQSIRDQRKKKRDAVTELEKFRAEVEGIMIKRLDASEMRTGDALKAEKKLSEDALKAEEKQTEDALKAEKKRTDVLKTEEKRMEDALKAMEKRTEDALKAEKKRTDVLKAEEKRTEDALKAMEKRTDDALEAVVKEWKNALKDERAARLQQEQQAKEKLDALLFNNYQPLYRIRLRAALEHIQSLFDQEIEAPSERKTDDVHSRNWRSRLDAAGLETDPRVKLARSLLANSAKFEDIIRCDESMKMICQYSSPIQLTAASLAHSYGYTGAEADILTDPVERKGMGVILSSLSMLRIPG